MENILDNIEKIRQIDKSDMLKLLADFPSQCQDAIRIAQSFPLPKGFEKINKVVFTGLGGSAIGADLVRAYLYDEIKLPLFINRDYTLPAFVDENTLVFVSSYSGNTEETLSSFEGAKKRNTKIIVISSGGKLGEIAKSQGLPFVVMPKNIPPRVALGYSFFVPLVLLQRLGFVGDKSSDIKETVNVLSKLRNEELSPEVKTDKNTAKNLARKIINRFAVIYGASQHLDSVVIRWRGQFAENSKTLSSSHVFPEMDHNEISGWEFPKELLKKFIVILLRDKSEHPRVTKRMQISKKMIQDAGTEVLEVNSKGDSLLARIFSLIYIGDFTSFYLAVLNNVDPTPVDRITYLKKEMAKENW